MLLCWRSLGAQPSGHTLPIFHLSRDTNRGRWAAGRRWRGWRGHSAARRSSRPSSHWRHGGGAWRLAESRDRNSGCALCGLHDKGLSNCFFGAAGRAIHPRNSAHHISPHNNASTALVPQSCAILRPLHLHFWRKCVHACRHPRLSAKHNIFNVGLLQSRCERGAAQHCGARISVVGFHWCLGRLRVLPCRDQRKLDATSWRGLRQGVICQFHCHWQRGNVRHHHAVICFWAAHASGRALGPHAPQHKPSLHAFNCFECGTSHGRGGGWGGACCAGRPSRHLRAGWLGAVSGGQRLLYCRCLFKGHAGGHHAKHWCHCSRLSDGRCGPHGAARVFQWRLPPKGRWLQRILGCRIQRWAHL